MNFCKSRFSWLPVCAYLKRYSHSVPSYLWLKSGSRSIPPNKQYLWMFSFIIGSSIIPLHKSQPASLQVTSYFCSSLAAAAQKEIAFIIIASNCTRLVITIIDGSWLFIKLQINPAASSLSKRVILMKWSVWRCPSLKFFHKLLNSDIKLVLGKQA